MAINGAFPAQEQKSFNNNSDDMVRTSSFSVYSFSPPVDHQRLSQFESGIPMNTFQPHQQYPWSSSSSFSVSPSLAAGSSSVLASQLRAQPSGAATSEDVEPSATDLERQLLSGSSAEAAHDGPPGPLLSSYSKSTSSIRKDFTTVDWWFSKAQMHRVRRLLRERNIGRGWQGKVKNIILAGQGWLVLALVGVLTGGTASIIHLVSAWLSDLKDGRCVGHNIFCTKRVCCMDEQDYRINPALTCQSWQAWNSDVSSGFGADLLGAFVYTLLAVSMAVTGSWICVVYARQAAGSGIAELKIVLGGFIIKKFLGIRTLFFKTAGLTLAVASGMALGKEGPMVHIACAWGNILSRPFLKFNTSEVKKREILSAAVAAGVTAAFGSPLGGVLFSLEVCSSYFPPKTMWRAFWAAICTALVLQWIDPFETGQLVQFAVSIHRWQWFELFPFVLLGAMGGVLGAFFIHLNLYFTRLRKRTGWIRSRPVGEIFVLGLVTAVVSYPNIFSRGNSGALLAQLFSSCDDVTVWGEDDRNQGPDKSVLSNLCDGDQYASSNMIWLLLAAAAKFFLTTMTYGSSIPSGVFMPSLCVGALLGRLLGWLMRVWHVAVGDVFIFSVCAGKTNCINPALYAVIGAASVLGGITRMTVSLAVIIFEVTGGLDIIVPIMVAVVCAKWCGDAFGKASLYGQLIELNGLPHIDPHEELDLVSPAVAFMVRDPVCVTTYGQTLDSLRALLADELFHGFPIIDNPTDRLVTGFIARSDLELEIEKASEQSREGATRCHFSREPPPFPAPHHMDFSTYVEKYPVQVRPSMPVDRIMGLFQALGLRYVLCCSPRGRILGLIKKKDLLVYLQNANVHHR